MMNKIPERNEFYRYCAENLQTGEIIESDESLAPITMHIRKNVKIPHGNKIRTGILEHGVVYVQGYGRHDNNRSEYYSWKLYVERW